MTNRVLLEPGGDALLVEPGSYLLYEAEFQIIPPDGRTVHVAARSTVPAVPVRQGVWVPPRNPPGGS